MQRKFFFKGQTQHRERGGGADKNGTLIGGGSPRLFGTFTDPSNVIFMLCFKINDAVFFYICVLNTVRWLILVACVNYNNVRVNWRGAHFVIVILY